MAGDFTGETWQGRGFAWGGRGRVFPWIPWHPVQTLGQLKNLMSAKCFPYMYGAPNIFYFIHSIVKTVKMMVQRIDFERILKNICPATVSPSIKELKPKKNFPLTFLVQLGTSAL